MYKKPRIIKTVKSECNTKKTNAVVAWSRCNVIETQ